MQQQSNHSQKASPKSQNIKTDSFLETIKGLGSSVVDSTKNDLLKPGIRDFFDSLSPFGISTDKQTQNSEEKTNFQENSWERKNQQLLRQQENFKRGEKIIFNRQERETQVQVRNIQEEIKKLASATGELAHEVQVATMQEEVNPGVYHINFLQKLLSFIKELRVQVQESSSWLASCNQKSQKKGGYWNKFKKSGSSFSLHHDRSVATQAG